MQFDDLFTKINTTLAAGCIKQSAADFVVIENNDIDFTEQGEHLWLKIQKTGLNTNQLASILAKTCGVSQRQVSYAGLKDRHATTQQWFSVQLPKIATIDGIQSELPKTVHIQEHHWHQKKLKTGCITNNEFQLTARNLEGNTASINSNIDQIKQTGVPNYFGPQRFGHQMGNIQQASDWFSGQKKVNNRNLRSLLLSSARSHLFNLIVSQRIKQGIWNQIINGDIVQLAGSHSWFHAADAKPDELTRRLDEFDVHITAALYGEDSPQSTHQCADMEQSIADSWPVYQTGFEKFRVKQDRRAIRVIPQDFEHELSAQTLQLRFKLPSGSYATSVLREVLHLKQDV